MKNSIYKLAVAIGYMLLYSEHAISACIQSPSFNNVQAYVPARTFTLQYDDTGQRDLETISIRYLNDGKTYSNNDGDCGYSYLIGNYVNSWVPNASKVAPTNIAGIGISVSTAAIGSFNSTFGPSNPGSYAWGISDTVWHITIKKTGQVTTSDSIRSGMIARLTQTNTTPNSTWYLTALNMPANAIKINVLSCSLKSNQSTYNVNMGDWYDTQFNNIGDTSDMVNIPITLTCKAGTNIKTTITSSGGYVDAATGKLALSSINKATGVAIQLLDKNNLPIKLNTKNSLQNSVPEGDYMFDWKARYIKTENQITPGTANATATVNIRYE
ncbi:fimbrial protein [Providencia sp. Je.9.19]|uniref:fimbrial protein n=1 Tax=Providencia sp. Je.9.19 TaxID=3142844 RepID=UPI003DA86FE3